MSENATLSGDARALRVVLCTAPDPNTAARLGRLLVDARLAACVNVLPGLRSIYRWQGAIEDDSEALMIIKSTADRLAELESRLSTEHPYDVPEIVALTPERVASSYLAWALTETRQP